MGRRSRRRGFLSSALLLVLAVTPSALPATKSSDHEHDAGRAPPLQFQVETAKGDSIAVTLNTPFTIAVGAEQTTLTLRMDPYRVFHEAGIQFRFPQWYAFEADLENPSLLTWVLSGNDAKIIVFRGRDHRQDAAALRHAVVTHLLSTYGQRQVKQHDASLTLGPRRLEGIELEVMLAGQWLRQTIVSWMSGSTVGVLILQDAPSEDGTPSQEGEALKRVLRESAMFDDV